ncbi:sensor histidine kinase [Agromyces seonyuensis]|uniref:histidine kinase n=1 Tax=Agromyces seonyuensis TaxID=2662446 RepID=A0A6I4P6R1_9MICO|nr:sensor histidine kinase [Agromyces seonyuensis]MWB99354.1 hypothetical protein [Agromyces seonyuensis]
MTRLRWWDAAAVGVALIVVGLTLVQPPYGPDDVGVWSATAAFLLVYAFLGRPMVELEDAAPVPRQVVALVAFCLVLAVGCAFDPGYASLQCFIYPFIWVTGCNLRVVLGEHVVVAAAIIVGSLVGRGWDALGVALGTAALSVAFSIAFGLWIMSMVRQGEERSRLLDELQAAQGALAAANRAAGVEAERARLAREIHDTIAQSLTGLVVVAQRAGRSLAKDDPGAAREDVALIETIAREALAETRTLVAATAAPDANAGLVASIERVAAAFARETGLRVDVDLAGLPGGALPTGALDREHEVVVLRSVQEGLSNVRKHAGADRAVVSLALADAAVRVRVDDDGRGPSPSGSPDTTSPGEAVSEAPSHTGSGGFGLAGLRDRVGLVGGTLRFGPAPAGGARLEVAVPVTAAASGKVEPWASV